jgi:hypothetical protein
LLVAAHPEIETRSLLPETATSDVAARLDAVVTAFLRLIVDTEAQQRTMLRLLLDPDQSRRGQLPLRKGRAIGWISEALSPLRGVMAERDLKRLVLAIRIAAGIEALVWLTDIAGLSRKDSVQLMRWSATALLRSAMAGSGPVGQPIRRMRPIEGSSRQLIGGRKFAQPAGARLKDSSLQPSDPARIRHRQSRIELDYCAG